MPLLDFFTTFAKHKKTKAEETRLKCKGQRTLTSVCLHFRCYESPLTTCFSRLILYFIGSFVLRLDKKDVNTEKIPNGASNPAFCANADQSILNPVFSQHSDSQSMLLGGLKWEESSIPEEWQLV